MKRCAYLLYGDHASGIINSQAVDVVKYLDSIPEVSCKLVAFLPYPFASKTHVALEKFYGKSLSKTRALPQRLWPLFLRWESLRLAWKVRQGKIETIICRGAFATLIALETRNKFCKTLRVCYDGRGAMAAEHEEYGIYPSYLENFMYMSESRSVLESDIRIAVTSELVEYWENRYGYQSSNNGYCVVIPTTLSNNQIKRANQLEECRSEKREELALKQNEILLVYSGSTAGWQSLELLSKHLNDWLKNNDLVKVLILSKPHHLFKELQLKFPNRITEKFVEPPEVFCWLSAGDYGLLIRDKSITNSCASPTKFAEYLLAGLRVLSNDTTGAGAGIGMMSQDELTSSTRSERELNRGKAIKHFEKNNFREEYESVTKQIKE